MLNYLDHLLTNAFMSCTSCHLPNLERIVANFGLAAEKQLPQHFSKKGKVVVIAGPTCAGKSRLAIDLARRLHGEVVSADSMQVYRGMDIGTAKVSKDECAKVPHHLLDIRGIQEEFNVVDFYYEARKVCQEILSRGAVPIVTGGSGFYLHALLYGPPSGPPSVPEVREQIEREVEESGADVLYQRLLTLDPVYAKTITKNDKQKIVRAIEIITLTNKKVSDHTWKGVRKPLQYDFRCWFVHYPRPFLYQKIEERCDQMLAAGFLEEVIRLEKEGIRQNSSASQAIGYRQALDFLATEKRPDDYLAFVRAFKQATRNYAKRQLTWFKKEPLFRWLDLQEHPQESVFQSITEDLAQGESQPL